MEFFIRNFDSLIHTYYGKHFSFVLIFPDIFLFLNTEFIPFQNVSFIQGSLQTAFTVNALEKVIEREYLCTLKYEKWGHLTLVVLSMLI